MAPKLPRFVLLIAAAIAALWWCAGVFGAAPTVVLDIPTVTATRMSPCVVSASINFSSSSTGDSSTWSTCRVEWQLEADGTALNDWPEKYRYVNDPRPGLNNKQIDLAGQTDTSNHNRPRGFAFAWCLTQGTWRIKCTVTNPEGSSTTTTSSDITIAADTRTEYTVQASGGDYTTLAAALTARAATDNIKITVEDGHTENMTGELTSITGDNMLIQQSGTGTKPLLTFTNASLDDTAYFIKFVSVENGVIENIEFADSTGDAAGETPDSVLQAINNQGSTNTGAIGCKVYGTEGVTEFSGFTGGSNIDGYLVQNCESEMTHRYSFITGDGVGSSETFCGRMAIVGCDFGHSVSESVCRCLYKTSNITFAWNQCQENGNKSTIRFWACEYGAIYGCYMIDGDNTLGDNIGNPTTCTTARIEANYITGTAEQTMLAGGLEDNISDITVCNNIVKTADADGAFKVRGTNSLMAHNTLWCEDGYTTSQIRAFDAVASNGINCNLFLHDDKADMSAYCVDTTTTIGELNDNTFTDKAGAFARFDLSATETSAVNMNTNRAFATGNEEKDVTLDSSYVPDSSTTVTTQAEVYDDFFGTARSSTSWAGAVGSEPASESQGIFQTFIPGLIAQPAP